MIKAGQSELATEVVEVIRGRRTIGSFCSDRPPREILLAAMDVARWAPNHRKTEPWQVLWLGPDTIQAVIEINSQIIAESKGPEAAAAKHKKWAEIPGWLVVTCDSVAEGLQRDEDYAACCCLIQNLSLVLWSAGIGTKWTTGEVTRHPEFLRRLGINPLAQRVVGLVWYGYPAKVPEQTRRSLESFLVQLP
ncbi:MAG: nitroreductase family protein [Planctomycetales bacterium]|jgi:nitroreductase|nr:nitroreductase family protein [Planctomycetales bacterium]